MKDVRFKPHSFQQMALDADKRFIAAVAGKRGGKSTLGAVWLINEIQRLYQQGKVGHFLIAAPTHGILQQATLPAFKEFFGQLGWGDGKGNGWHENKSLFQLKWRTAGGEPCYIYVRSTDEPEHIEGMTVLAAWLDEAGQMKEGTWDNVQARLSVDMGRCIITTTPYAPNWFWREIMAEAGSTNAEVSDAPEANPDIALFRWRTVDNPAFSSAEYERLKRTMSPDKFARDYGGEARAMEGLVYQLPDEAIVRPFPIPADWKRFAGMDFGQSDPTVILCVAEKPEEQGVDGKDHKPSVFYAYKEFYKKGALLQQSAEFLQNEPLDYILHDPSAAQQAAELTRGFGVRKMLPADNRREVGIERLKGLISEGRLKFIRGRVDNTIREILNYHYRAPSLDHPQKDDPVGVNDHCMDAMRYAFSRENMQGLYYGIRKKKVVTASRQPSIESWGGHQQDYDRFTSYPL